MPTRRLTVDPQTVQTEDLAAAVAWLREGSVVAFPTDTLYGLAVDPFSDAAVRVLFDLKGRPARAAIPLLADSIEQVEAVCGPMGSTGARLAAAWWPGPLSLILDAPARVSVAIHGGRRSVAIRVPAHPVARALARAFGSVVTATSANLTGETPAASVDALAPLADDRRVFVIDAGPATGGAPSTIVDARGSTPELVRAGAIPWERVLESLQE
jgi:L-threonylcarbamoyladenylate synthase